MAYSFKLPLVTDLTLDQITALNHVDSISVSGGPGTGKSVVSLWRHVRNYGIGGKTSLLLTYTKTLEHYLVIASTNENVDAGKAVDRTLRWLTDNPENYDEIIVDEAQDVDSLKNTSLKSYSENISYGADNQQILDPKRATSEGELKNIFKTTNYPLSENFRNSFEILNFSKALFPTKLIPQYTLNNLKEEGRTGNKPIIITTEKYQAKENQLKAIKDIINLFSTEINSSTHNLAILVPLKKHVEAFNLALESLNLNMSHTYYYEGCEFNGIENIHITTFKSAKGLEFDTVIIPDFQNYEWNIKNLTDAPITENDYYVGVTRARRNLYLITSNLTNLLQGRAQQSTYTIEKY